MEPTGPSNAVLTERALKSFPTLLNQTLSIARPSVPIPLDARGKISKVQLFTFLYRFLVEQIVSNDNNSHTFSARAQTAGPNPHALGNCQLYDLGVPSSQECSDDTHIYSFISPAPAVDSPEFLTIACSTECPYADGQQYTASKGEVRSPYAMNRMGIFILIPK